MSSYSTQYQVEQSDESLHQWFAVQVTPKMTQPVLTTLRQKGVEAFTPCQTVIRKWADRTSETQVPVFPGYVFARMDIRYRLPVLVTPGVHSIIGFGKQPSPVSDVEIEAVKRVMDSGLTAEPTPFMQAGDTVELIDGPLAGLSGVLLSQKNATRVLVRVTLIQQAMAVDVDLAWVRPVQQRTVPARA